MRRFLDDVKENMYAKDAGGKEEMEIDDLLR